MFSYREIGKMGIILLLFTFGIYGGLSAALQYYNSSTVSEVYGVTFGEEGGNCDPGVPAFDFQTGDPLECRGFGGAGKVKGLPGFAEKEKDEVFDLVDELAQDGLDIEDQRRVHERVKEIAASLPDSRRPYYYDSSFFGIRGSSQIPAGIGALVVSLAAGVWYLARTAATKRRLRSRRTNVFRS